jgi:hypothetical protein
MRFSCSYAQEMLDYQKMVPSVFLRFSPGGEGNNDNNADDDQLSVASDCFGFQMLLSVRFFGLCLLPLSFQGHYD